MTVKFIVDEGKYRAGKVYDLEDREAVKYLRERKAIAYMEPLEKAVNDLLRS